MYNYLRNQILYLKKNINNNFTFIREFRNKKKTKNSGKNLFLKRFSNVRVSFVRQIFS